MSAVTAKPSRRSNGMSAVSQMALTLDVGPSVASQREYQRSSARETSRGIGSTPGIVASSSRANDAVTSRPRTPGMITI
jgi:hypothetical protein